MKVTGIIQARMTSTRLPGKVLQKVNGKPLLEYQWERLQRSRALDELIIATTVETTDDPIQAWCEKKGIACFRGSEEDVLARYYLAAQKFGGEHIVRITADCPLIDPMVVDKVINYYLEKYPQYDYVSNTLERTYPRGMDTEVFSFSVLEQAYKEAKEQSEREHVTVYIYKRDSVFRLAQVKQAKDWSRFRWTVDTPEDFQLISTIIKAFSGGIRNVDMDTIVQLFIENPEWLKINAEIEQKKV